MSYVTDDLDAFDDIADDDLDDLSEALGDDDELAERRRRGRVTTRVRQQHYRPRLERGFVTRTEHAATVARLSRDIHRLAANDRVLTRRIQRQARDARVKFQTIAGLSVLMQPETVDLLDSTGKPVVDVNGNPVKVLSGEPDPKRFLVPAALLGSDWLSVKASGVHPFILAGAVYFALGGQFDFGNVHLGK